MSGCTPRTAPPSPAKEEIFIPREEAAANAAAQGTAAPDSPYSPASPESSGIVQGDNDDDVIKYDPLDEDQPESEPEPEPEKPVLVIDPLTRCEERLRLEVLVEDGQVKEAQVCSGVYRDFENILKNRDPRDAVQITQRISGPASMAHAVTAAMALDQAMRTPVPPASRLIRNLACAMDFIQAHILHYYQKCAPDFERNPAYRPQIGAMLTERAMPAFSKSFSDAMEARRLCHEAVALLAGRMPQPQGIMGGGCAASPSQTTLNEFTARFEKVKTFLQSTFAPEVYRQTSLRPDLCQFGKGHGNLLSMGAFPTQDDGPERAIKRGVYINGGESPLDPRLIKTHVKYSWFDDADSGLNFRESDTRPAPDKPDAYSYVKAARYNGHPVETGPLARMWISSPGLSEESRKLALDNFGVEAKRFRALGDELTFSLMGRHIARVEEALYLSRLVDIWLKEIRPDRKSMGAPGVPDRSEGLGMYEAPAGSLLHYVRIENKKIASYQIIGPASWNFSPRDELGHNGTLERALEGVPVQDPDKPLNVTMLARAFGA